MPFDAQDFQIGEKFAEGAFGETFVGRHQAPDATLCAVKRLRSMAVDRSHLTAVLTRLRALDGHPGIVPVLGWSMESPPSWIASEFQRDGPGIAPNISDLFGSFRDEEDAFPLLFELASTLGALHAEGILHGNLHPGNVFLAPEGSDSRCRIGDFGQAYIGAAHHVSLTTETLRTLAPEQLLRPDAFQSQSAFRWDVYAFGVLAYRLLTGEWPRGQRYMEMHLAECEIHHGASIQPDIHRFLASLQNERQIRWHDDPVSEPCQRIRDVVTQCLSIEPENRPRTGGDVQFRLAHIAHEIEFARSERRFDSVRKDLRTRLFLARGSVLVLVSLLTLATLYGASTLYRAKVAETAVVDRGNHLLSLSASIAQTNSAYAVSLNQLSQSRDAADQLFSHLARQDPLTAKPRILSDEDREWIELARSYYRSTLQGIGNSWNADLEAARAHHNLALASLALGETPLADDHFRQAINLLDPLSRNEAKGELHAELFSRLGDCHRQIWIQHPPACTDTALDHLVRSAEAFVTALESRPDDPQLVSNAAAAFFYLGLHQGECRLRHPALTSYSRCLELLALVEKLRPPSPENRFLAARAYTASGTLLKDTNRGPAALDAQVLALGILLELTAESPGQTEFAVELAHCYCELGDLFQSLKNDPSAPESDPAQMLNEANRILLAVLNEQPSHPRATVTLARTYMGQSKLNRENKKTAEALQLAQQAVSLLTELVGKHPDNRQFPFHLAHHKVDFMQLLAAVAKSQDAIKFGVEASATLESLLDDHRDTVAEPVAKAYHLALADLHDQLGSLTEKTSNSESAAEHYARAVGYWELLANHYNSEEEFGARLKASRSMLQRVRR